MNFNPLSIEICFTHGIRNEPNSIRSDNDSEFGFEISRDSESRVPITKKKLNLPQYPQTVEVKIPTNDKIKRKGLNYNQENNIQN